MAFQRPESPDSRVRDFPSEPGLPRPVEGRDIEAAVGDPSSGALQSTTDLNFALFEAVKRDDVEEVKRLVEAGADVGSAYGYDIRTPLHSAAAKGNSKIVQYLLDAGAAVDPRTRYGATPLFSALQASRHYDISIQDTGSSADPKDTCDPEPPGGTAPRHREVIELLLEKGATVESAAPFGDEALVGVYATALGDLSVVRCLVEHAADRDRFLNPPHKAYEFTTLLGSAVAKGHLHIVRYLIEAGADPLLKNARSELPIHQAFQNEDSSNTLEIIRFLVSVNVCQLQAKAWRNDTCLHLAVETDNVECVDWLISEGADCTAMNDDGETPWRRALGRGNLDMVGVFLRKEISSVGFRNRFSEHGSSDSPIAWFYPYPYNTWQAWGGNRSVYAILGMRTCTKLLGLTHTSYLDVLQKIDHSFVEHSEPGRPLCVREAACTFEMLSEGTKFTSISMPYFSSRPLGFLSMRWKIGLKNIEGLKYCRTGDPRDFGADIEVTLDEYCNPALGLVLERRNEDQVLTRYGKRTIASKASLDDTTPNSLSQPRLVTVPQLWCWKIGSKLIFNGLRSARGSDEVPLHDLETEQDPSDLYLGIRLSGLIESLDRPGMLGLSESIFSVFSKSISIVAEEVNEYTCSTKFDDISIEKEKQFLHEINDIREEIAMMRTVLFQQQEIWKEFTYNTWPQFWPDGEEGRFRPPSNNEDKLAGIWRVIGKPQAQFPKYRKRFEKLDEDAGRVEKHIIVQLDLKQKHAAIKETHTTTVMSTAIVGFTVITIIFAPLSFLTSLFALTVDQFQQSTDGKYAAGYIGKWIATGEIISLTVTAVVIWLACEYFLKLRVTRRMWHLLSKQPFIANGNDLFRDLVNKMWFWKFGREKGRDGDLESGR